MSWYVDALRHYATFSGRAHRTAFWMFVLVNLLVSVGLSIVENSLSFLVAGHASAGVVTGLYHLAVLLPTLAIGARRLHDTDRSGWWLLIGLVPLVGTIVLIVLWAQPTVPGTNRFGAEPSRGPVAAPTPMAAA